MKLCGGSLVQLLLAFLVAVNAKNGTPDIHLHVTDIGTDTFTLSWDDVPNMAFTSYEVVLTGGEGNQKVVPVAAKAGTKPTKIITGLEPGQPYNITIYGIQNGTKVHVENLLKIVLTDGEGHKMVIPLGSEADTKPTEVAPGQSHGIARNGTEVQLKGLVQYTAPLPPKDVSYNQLSGTDSIKVSWTPPEGKFNKFVIKYSLDGEPKRKVVSGVESSFVFTDLKEGQELAVLSISSGAGTHPDELIESKPVVVQKDVQTDQGETGKTASKIEGKPVVPYESSEMEQKGSGYTASSMPRWRVVMIISAVTGTVFLLGLLLAAIVYIVRRRYQI